MSSTQRDQGLQSERTALAWRRTALAIAVNALLALRSGIAGQGVLILVGTVLLAGAAIVAVYGYSRGKRLVAGQDRQTPSAVVLVSTMLVTWLAAVAACTQILGLVLTRL